MDPTLSPGPVPPHDLPGVPAAWGVRCTVPSMSPSASSPAAPAGPAWLHTPIELPLLMLLRQRLRQQLDTAAAWGGVLPSAAALALDARGGAGRGPALWRPVRPVADPRAARAALRRMAEGRYGWCLRCGQAISRDRLLAQPAASTCEACATGRADTGPQAGQGASPRDRLDAPSPDAAQGAGQNVGQDVGQGAGLEAGLI